MHGRASKSTRGPTKTCAIPPAPTPEPFRCPVSMTNSRKTSILPAEFMYVHYPCALSRLHQKRRFTAEARRHGSAIVLRNIDREKWSSSLPFISLRFTIRNQLIGLRARPDASVPPWSLIFTHEPSGIRLRYGDTTLHFLQPRISPMDDLADAGLVETFEAFVALQVFQV